MFFYLSKVLWLVLAPSNLLVGAATLIALAAARRGRPRLLIGFATVLVIASFSPLGLLLIAPLENRFPQPDLAAVKLKGIIVLGGPIDPTVAAARGMVHLLSGAERLTASVALARRYPNVPLVYSGGTNAIVVDEGSEAADAKRLWLSLGVPAQQIVIEDRSRNTAENAVNTQALLHPKPGDQYLLVTSAYHMPRSVGLFRKAGFTVIPYPVDYRTAGNIKDWVPVPAASQGLANLDFAAREWIGLLAYFLSGKIEALFPAP